jgi:hypothetical protein
MPGCPEHRRLSQKVLEGITAVYAAKEMQDSDESDISLYRCWNEREQLLEPPQKV